ncbi:MAG: molybdenum cofactor biosynthesis protein MoaE [Actinomycetota bacterium]|nr:molybdenum cofactor biosynthesis protein MoaE [Actinomycetota bacterium]
MTVRVRLFAMLRERAGADEVQLELPDGARVGDALARLGDLAGGMRLVMAVNREYVDAEAPLSPGDELALIPPVSGGAGAEVSSSLTVDPISVDALLARVRDARAGAVVTFLGVTREVDFLNYEAYVEMASERIHEIVDEAAERHDVSRAIAEHRVGTVPLSEPSVAVAVSAPHRAEAFAAAREIIDRIKAEVPIWKQEEGEWAAGTSPELR